MLSRVRRSCGLRPARSRRALAIATLAGAIPGPAVVSAAVRCHRAADRAGAGHAVPRHAGRLAAVAEAGRGSVRRQAAMAARHAVGWHCSHRAARLRTVWLEARTVRLLARHVAAAADLHSVRRDPVRRDPVRRHPVRGQAVARQHATALTGTALTSTALTSTAVAGAPVLPRGLLATALLATALRAEAAVLAEARLAGTALVAEATLLPAAVLPVTLLPATVLNAAVRAATRLATTVLAATVLAATRLATASAVARRSGHARLAVLAKLAVAEAVLAQSIGREPGDRDLVHTAGQRAAVIGAVLTGAGLTGAGLTAAVVGCPVLLKTRPLLHAGLWVSFLARVPALAEAPRGNVASGDSRLLVLLALHLLAQCLLALRPLSRGLEPYRRLCLCGQSYC